MLDIDFLRQSGATPHWFGLGFIQLKLDDKQRIHFWHPDLRPDVPEEEVHDHRYTFESRILRGELIHETFTFEGQIFGSYEMVEVSCDADNPVTMPKKVYGNLIHTGTYRLGVGTSYTFPINEFHRTRAERAVTLVTREDTRKPFARVIRDRGAPEVCPFANPMPEARLWEVMADLLGTPKVDVAKPGYHIREIARGVLGEASKVREEVEEFIDATEQGVSIMALVELSDMVGSVEAYLAKHHPSIGLDDLKAMSNVTKRAFINGRRN